MEETVETDPDSPPNEVGGDGAPIPPEAGASADPTIAPDASSEEPDASAPSDEPAAGDDEPDPTVTAGADSSSSTSVSEPSSTDSSSAAAPDSSSPSAETSSSESSAPVEASTPSAEDEDLQTRLARIPINDLASRRAVGDPSILADAPTDAYLEQVARLRLTHRTVVIADFETGDEITPIDGEIELPAGSSVVINSSAGAIRVVAVDRAPE